VPLVRQLTRCTWRSQSSRTSTRYAPPMGFRTCVRTIKVLPRYSNNCRTTGPLVRVGNGAQPPQTFVYGSSAHPLPPLRARQVPHAIITRKGVPGLWTRSPERAYLRSSIA